MNAVLILVVAGLFFLAIGGTIKHYADQLIDEILAAELRQIDRERVRGLDANKAARWSR